MTAGKKTNEIFDYVGFLKNLTRRPGVYRMVDSAGKIIYVGKAKNLKNRVSSYFRTNQVSPKQQVMLGHIASIDVTITRTESEALLLENQLIKKHRPRYNICLRDDKSYPYIYVTTQHSFPRLSFHRGKKSKYGRYFGPFPSASAVRESLKLLQKIFPVRQCEDSYFSNRSRPCLQYQIERCTAPCVGLVSEGRYQQDVDDTILFLEGQGHALIDKLIERMEKAAANLNFESAAHFRDQIATLRTVLEKQYVAGERGDLDLIACHIRAGVACVQVVFVRKGQLLGDKSFYPAIPNDATEEDVLTAFIPQYYLGKYIPVEIVLSHSPLDPSLLAQVLSEEVKHQVILNSSVRGDRAKWLDMARTNAENRLQEKLTNRQDQYERFIDLQSALSLESIPARIECFDISHTQGEQTVASCVVFDQEGPVKSAYRRFNISGITPGDDYAALAQAVTRRFKRIQNGEYLLPDILLIDGGKGQLTSVFSALESIGMDKNLLIVGVAKGVDRKPGMETLFTPGSAYPIAINSDSSAHLLIQHIRDEAHRFAITGHRQRRAKLKKQSTLEAIPGMGPKRRQKLLRQFGGLKEVKKAGVEALCTVDGISKDLAQRIYDTFHEREI